MGPKTIFFSWMSDIPSGCNRKLIKDAVALVCEERKQEQWHLEERIDEATTDAKGAIDIVSSLIKKIDLCSIFIADITLINTGAEVDRYTPNPNVLFELGYAVNVVGWENIILIFNEAYGDIKDLPFDIQGQRIFKYSLLSGSDKKKEREGLTKILKGALDIMLEQQPYIATIKTAIKLEVDRQIMEIGNHIYKLLYDTPSLIMPRDILNMMAIKEAAIASLISSRILFGFEVLKIWESYIIGLKEVKNNAVYSKYMSNPKMVGLIRLIEALEIASRNFIIFRFYKHATDLQAPNFLKLERKRDGGYLLMAKTTDCWEIRDEGIFYPGDESNLLKIYEPVEEDIQILATCLKTVFDSINALVDAWDGAIIVNPALSRLS